MRNKKAVMTLLAVAFVAILCVMWISPIHADVGNSFGGGSSGSSSSGGSHYSGSGGSLSGLFFLFSSPAGGVVLVILVIVFILKLRAGNQGGRTYANPGIKSNQGFVEEEVVSRIRQEDPSFSPDNFKTFASEVWLTLQEAWEDKEWQKVRPFESNALFNVHNRQLQEYIDRKKTNFMEMQNVREVKIAKFRIDGEHEVATIKLDASLLDYIVDDESGKVIDGSKTNYVYRSYQLEFIRKVGVKTGQSFF